jgi:hypothetical protein
LENATPNEIDPVDKEQIEKSKKRLKISSIAMAIASIPGLLLLIIAILGAAAILPEAVLSIIVLFTLISIPILIFFSTVALVYLLKQILNKSDRSLFRTKFRKFAAIASIVIGIAAMLFLVLSGGMIGLLMYLVLINLFNELAWLVPLFGIFVSGIEIAGIYAVLASLNTIFIAISFKEFKKSLFSIIGHVVGWIAGIVAGIVVFIALLLFVV